MVFQACEGPLKGNQVAPELVDRYKMPSEKYPLEFVIQPAAVRIWPSAEAQTPSQFPSGAVVFVHTCAKPGEIQSNAKTVVTSASQSDFLKGLPILDLVPCIITPNLAQGA